MLRKLLACLALLTGLAAAGAPAQAEVASALASRIVASAHAETVVARSREGIVDAVSACPVAATVAVPVPAPTAGCAPAVRPGIDRARE